MNLSTRAYTGTCAGAQHRCKCQRTSARSGSSPGLSRCMAAPSTFGVAAGPVHRAVVAHLRRAHTCTLRCGAAASAGVSALVVRPAPCAFCESFTLAIRADCHARAASTRARIVPNVVRRWLPARSLSMRSTSASGTARAAPPRGGKRHRM